MSSAWAQRRGTQTVADAPRFFFIPAAPVALACLLAVTSASTLHPCSHRRNPPGTPHHTASHCFTPLTPALPRSLGHHQAVRIAPHVAAPRSHGSTRHHVHPSASAAAAAAAKPHPCSDCLEAAVGGSTPAAGESPRGDGRRRPPPHARCLHHHRCPHERPAQHAGGGEIYVARCPHARVAGDRAVGNGNPH
jgi:hypothetical protein